MGGRVSYKAFDVPNLAIRGDSPLLRIARTEPHSPRPSIIGFRVWGLGFRV